MADFVRIRKERERELGNGVKPGRKGPSSTVSSTSSLPPHFQSDDFKGTFSFDDFYKILVSDVLQPVQEESPSILGSDDPLPNGSSDPLKLSVRSGPPFAEAEALDPLFKDARKNLIDLCSQVDARLEQLKQEVSTYGVKHTRKIGELEAGVDMLYERFGKLDSRISGVSQTAARIGDHLQSADAQREAANKAVEVIKYLMEFNGSPGDLMELSPLFSDDRRVAEAAAVAQKLRSIAEDDFGMAGTVKNTPNASAGLEVAVVNLQDYCNELENRLLARFDAASQRRELATMAECAKILSQFNRGLSAMQRYVASRPMFMDVELMESDAKTVLGDPSNVAKGLNILYKEILDTVQQEGALVASVFPSPDAVMSILVQRILEQRVSLVLDRVLVKPSLTGLRLGEEAGVLLQYLRMLASSIEKTQELAKELQALGCGDLDAEGLAEDLFSTHRDEYPELEQASLCQLYEAKMAEIRSVAPTEEIAPNSITPVSAASRHNRSLSTYGQQIVMSVSVVTEFVRWNEEAVQRCTLVTPQPIPLATNVRAIFTCLLDQVSTYTTEGLERAQEALNEAAVQRERFTIGSSMSRRVAAAAAAAAEAAAHAGESSVRSFMVAVHRATANVSLVQQHFVNTVTRLLLPVDGAHAAMCEEMANAMANSENAALKGLQVCIDTILAEAERLLAVEQKVADYKPPEDGNPPDHRPTSACTRVVAYLARMLEAVHGALEGLNKQAFMTELGNRLHRALITHWQRFVFSASGGLKLKRDVSEYAEFMRSFKAPVVDEKFEQLGTLVNVFIVAPESLPNLVDSSLKLARRDAIRFIQLREDYRSAKIATRFPSSVLE